MSAPVDVLAVLEQATYTLSLPDNNTPNDQLSIPALREARAAVAELIEAAECVIFDASITSPGDHFHEIGRQSIDRLYAALARVGGAA